MIIDNLYISTNAMYYQEKTNNEITNDKLIIANDMFSKELGYPEFEKTDNTFNVLNISWHLTIASKTLLLGLTVLFLACSSPHYKLTDTVSKPKVFIAKGYIVPKDSISAPVIISAGKPILTHINITDEKLKISNIHPAVGLGISKTLTPAICTMGTKGFTFPKVVIPIEKHVFCLPPEVVLVKDAYVKDINPQNFSSFSKLQGLRHDQIRSIIQDRMGNIWMGTDDGLTKYDGKYFSHYTTNQGLKNNLILSVYQDSKGNIWFGTFGGGVTKYDGRYLTSFSTSEDFLNNIVNSIFEDNIGNLWFGTGGGAAKYDGKSFTNFTISEGLCHNDVRAITQDNAGRIWIATNGNGISVFDGKSFSNYSEKEGLIQNFINCMFKDKSNNIWLGTASEGIIKYDGVDFSVYSRNEGLSNNLIRSIIQDDEGNMWFGTSGGGISKFDGRYFTYYTESEGLSSNTIRSALKDSNGNLWFGTRGGGVARFDGRKFTHVTVNEGLSNSKIMAILQDKADNLWFGTFGDYVTIQSTRVVNGISHNYFTQFGKKEGLLNTRVYSIIQDKNANIWFGSDGGGISRLSRDSKTLATYTNAQGLCGNTVRKIYQDREGNFWIATYGNGISKFDGKTFTNYSKKEGLGSNNILSIIQDNNNNLWFGTDDNGVTRFDGKNFTHFKKKDGLSNVVYTILQDNNGSLWFGTGGDGVIKYDGINFTNFTDKEGLNNTHVLSILQDMQNNLWFGTRFGLNVSKAEYFERNRKYPGMPWFKNFGYEDGFLGIGCNIAAINEDKLGIIRIGTNDRMTKFRPEDELIDSIPPNIQITNVQLFNEDIPWTELEGKEDTTIALHNGVNVGKFKFNGISKWYGLPQKLSLDYKNNYVTFNFIGISQTQTNKIKYQFKLEGLDENWNIPTNRTEASYGNLNYGNYNFKVKAMNCEGYWSNEVSYQFTIRPPWWKTRLFYFSLIFTLSLIMYGFMKYRERKLEHDKLLLQLKVQEQTFELTEKNKELQINNATKDKFFSIIAHDLRGPFSGFLGLTEIMVEDLPSLSMKDIHDIAISMKHSATNLFRLLENLLQWARIQRGLIPFNPEVMELLPIVRESADLLYETSKNKEIEISYIFPPHLKGLADSNLLQTVIRNLVSNAVKFTPKGGKILISASQTDEKTVEIAIKDSGIGMSPSLIDKIFRLDGQTNRKGTEGEPSTGLGLLLCKEFVEKHGGKLWAESVEGKGSTFYFTIPS